jgi:hypothetical protein
MRNCDPEASVSFSSSEVGSWGARASGPCQRASCERTLSTTSDSGDPEGRWNLAGGEARAASGNHRINAEKSWRAEGAQEAFTSAIALIKPLCSRYLAAGFASSIQPTPVDPLVPAPVPLPRMVLPLSRVTFPNPPVPVLQPELGPATAPGPVLLLPEPSSVVHADSQSAAAAMRMIDAFMMGTG